MSCTGFVVHYGSQLRVRSNDDIGGGSYDAAAADAEVAAPYSESNEGSSYVDYE